MKFKTAELEGPALCYAVCMIEMPHLVWGKTIGLHHASHQIVVPELPEPQCYSPFMGWDLAGPIVDRAGITIMGCYNDGAPRQGESAAMATIPFRDGKLVNITEYGPTRIIAAMRCHVASEYGDEVDIPEELL